MTDNQNLETIKLAAEIAAAYVRNNALSPTDLLVLVKSVHTTLSELHANITPAAPAETREPAVSIRKSIRPDYLICLEDGLKFKSLKRHLMTEFGLTPDQYRAKWNLPSDYPMVAPAYSAARSKLAKSFGLGRKASA